SIQPYNVANPSLRRFTSARNVPTGVSINTSFSKPDCAPDKGIRLPDTRSANSRSPRMPLSRLARPIIIYHLLQFSNRHFIRHHTAINVFKFSKRPQLFYSRPKIVDHAL